MSRRLGRLAVAAGVSIGAFVCAAPATASGTLTAPFPGIHGWYWENPSDAPVLVTLSAAGFFTMSHEFHKNTPPKTRMFP